MKAQLVDSTQPGDWIYEIKFDGYRALALRGGHETRILTCTLFGVDILRSLLPRVSPVKSTSIPLRF
jgi:hypothetical protein